MKDEWGALLPIVGAALGALALLGSGLFAARATRTAARMTSEAQRATAVASAEPAQRQADLATFREIRDGLERKLERQETRIDSLSTLVRAFSWYVSEMTTQMRVHRIEPPAPPERVVQYNRDGT